MNKFFSLFGCTNNIFIVYPSFLPKMSSFLYSHYNIRGSELILKHSKENPKISKKILTFFSQFGYLVIGTFIQCWGASTFIHQLSAPWLPIAIFKGFYRIRLPINRFIGSWSCSLYFFLTAPTPASCKKARLPNTAFIII